VGFVESWLKIAVDGDPVRHGFQAHPMYIFLNIAVPAILGVILGFLSKALERMIRRKKRRGE
jgi:hypothetical protein